MLSADDASLRLDRRGQLQPLHLDLNAVDGWHGQAMARRLWTEGALFRPLVPAERAAQLRRAGGFFLGRRIEVLRPGFVATILFAQRAIVA